MAMFQYTSNVNISESLFTGLYIIVCKTEGTSEEFYQEIVDYLNSNLNSFNIRNLVSKFINDETIDWVKQRNYYCSKLRLGPTQILWNTDPECASPSDHILNFSRSKFLLKLSTSVKHFNQPSKIQLKYIKEEELENYYISNIFYNGNVIATIIAHEDSNSNSPKLIKTFYDKKKYLSDIRKVKFQFLISRSNLDFARKLSDEFDRYAVVERMNKYNMWNDISNDDDLTYDSFLFLENRKLLFQSLNEVVLDILTTFLSQLVKILGDPNYSIEDVRKKTSQHTSGSKLKNIKYKGEDVKNYGDIYLVLNNYDMSIPYYLSANYYFSKEKNYLGNARCLFSLCVCICKKFKFSHFLTSEKLEDGDEQNSENKENKDTRNNKSRKDKGTEKEKETKENDTELEDKGKQDQHKEEKSEESDSPEQFPIYRVYSSSSLSSETSSSDTSSSEMDLPIHHKSYKIKKNSKSKQENIPKEMSEKPKSYLLYYIKRSFLLWLKSFDNSDEFSILFVFYVNVLLKIKSNFVNRVISSFIVYSNKMLSLDQQCNILKYIIEVLSSTSFSRKIKFYRFLYDEKMIEKALKDEDKYRTRIEEDNNNREQKQEKEEIHKEKNTELENKKKDNNLKILGHKTIKSHDLSLYNIIVFLCYNLNNIEVDEVFNKCNEYYYWYKIKKAITENEIVRFQVSANNYNVQKMFIFTLFNIFNSLSEIKESIKLKVVLDEVNQASLDVPKLDTKYFTISHLVLSNDNSRNRSNSRNTNKRTTTNTNINTGTSTLGFNPTTMYISGYSSSQTPTPIRLQGLKGTGTRVYELLSSKFNSLFTELKQGTHEVYFTGGFENIHFNKFPICFSINLIGHKFNFTYSKSKMKVVEHYYEPKSKNKSNEINLDNYCIVLKKKYTYKSFLKCNYMDLYRRNLMMYLISINSNRTMDSNLNEELEFDYVDGLQGLNGYNKDKDNKEKDSKENEGINNRDNNRNKNEPRCVILHEKITRNIKCRIRKVKGVRKLVKSKRTSLKLTKWNEEVGNNKYRDNKENENNEENNNGLTKYTQYIYDDLEEENVVYVDSVLNIELLFSNPLPIGLYLKNVVLLGHGSRFECIGRNVLLQSFTKQHKECFNIIIKEPGKVYITGIKFILFDTFECYQVLMDSSKVEEVVGFLNSVENIDKDNSNNENKENQKEDNIEYVDKKLIENFNSCAQLDLNAFHDYNKSSLEVYFTDFSDNTEITNFEVPNNLLGVKFVNRSLTNSTYKKLYSTFLRRFNSNLSSNRSNNSIKDNGNGNNDNNYEEDNDKNSSKDNNSSDINYDNIIMRTNLGSYRSSIEGSNVESTRSRYESWNGLRVPNFGQGTVSKDIKICDDEFCNWCKVFYHFYNKFTESISVQKLINGERKLIYVRLINKNKYHSFINIKISIIPTTYTSDKKGITNITTARDYVYEQEMKIKIENLKREIYSRYVIIMNEKCIIIRNNNNRDNKENENNEENNNNKDSTIEEHEDLDNIILRPGDWLYVPMVYRASDVLSSFNVIFDYEILNIENNSRGNRDNKDRDNKEYQQNELMKGNSRKYVNIEVDNRLRISDFDIEKNVEFNNEFFINNIYKFKRIYKKSTIELFRNYKHIFDQQYIKAYVKVNNDTKETYSCNINKRNPFIVSSGSSTRWCVKLRRLKYQKLKYTDSWQFTKIITSNLELKWNCYPDRIGSIKLYDLNTSKVNTEVLRRYVEGELDMGFVDKNKYRNKMNRNRYININRYKDNKENEYKEYKYNKDKEYNIGNNYDNNRNNKRNVNKYIYGDYTRSYVWKMNKLNRVPKWYWSNVKSLIYENIDHLVMSKLSLQISISLDEWDEGSTQKEFRVETGSKFKVSVLVRNRSDNIINDYRVIVLPYVNECYMTVYELEWAGSLDQIGQEPILPSSKYNRKNNKNKNNQNELDTSEQEFEYFINVAKVEFVSYHPCTMAINAAIIVERDNTIYWHHEPSIIYVD